MLAGGHFVVAVLDGDAHGLQGEDDVAADVVAEVQRRGVEVAALVQDLGALVVGEQEELQLRTHVVGQALLGGLGQDALQAVAGVAGVGRAVGVDHVAEHAGDRAVGGPPGADLEGGRIGHGHHVRLVDAAEAQDRGTVEAHAFLKGGLELLGRDLEAFQRAQDVHEPVLDEADIVVLDRLHDVVGVFALENGNFHILDPPGLVCRRQKDRIRRESINNRRAKGAIRLFSGGLNKKRLDRGGFPQAFQ